MPDSTNPDILTPEQVDTAFAAMGLAVDPREIADVLRKSDDALRSELDLYRSRQKDIAEWADKTFGKTTVEATVRRIDCELREFFDDPAGEAKDLVIFLYRLAEISGRNLDADVDAKMAINHKRQWVLAGDGTGQHTGSEQQIGLMAELTRLKERNREIAKQIRIVEGGLSGVRGLYTLKADLLRIADGLEAGK